MISKSDFSANRWIYCKSGTIRLMRCNKEAHKAEYDELIREGLLMADTIEEAAKLFDRYQ